MAPQLVPWITSQEFLSVYSALFSIPDEAGSIDLVQLRAGLHRIEAWSLRGTCPHQIESTSHLLNLLHFAPLPLNTLSRRLELNAALIRFVNGLVDPHQQGAYAMSISKIADRIGLPSHFVELRHRGTHEEVPEIEVLEWSVREALEWLRVRYWEKMRARYVPDLMEDEGGAREEALMVENLLGMVKDYKERMKVVCRDRSLEKSHARELERLKEGIKEWVGKEEEKIVTICGLLSEVGCLIPISKVKRAKSFDLPPELMNVWSPLLFLLNENTDGRFIPSLITCLTEKIFSSSFRDVSKSTTLSAWVVHLLLSPSSEASGSDIKTNAPPMLLETIRFALLSRTSQGLDFLHRVLSLPSIVQLLDSTLQERVTALMQAARLGDEEIVFEVSNTEEERRLAGLEDRLETLKEGNGRRLELEHEVRMEGIATQQDPSGSDVVSWRLESDRIPMGFFSSENALSYVPLSVS
ncbi:Las1-domain-containing protein [Atractiella rhizophila]|nr:Las1-domain-containing protein [Atractiella rhizophila]